MGASGVELADHRSASVGASLNSGAHTGTTGTHDDNIMLVVVHTVDDGGFFKCVVGLSSHACNSDR